MHEIYAATGRHISHEWAHRVAATIIGDRAPDHPMAYVLQAIRNEPNPRQRFLPIPLDHHHDHHPN
jgi:hypothetical protein